MSIQVVWIVRRVTDDYSPVLHNSPRPSPSVLTVESLAEEYKEEVVRTRGSEDMSIEHEVPDRLLAPVSPGGAETVFMHATRDTTVSTVAASRMPCPTANVLSNADLTPCKRKQNVADGNPSPASGRDHPGAPDDNAYHDNRRFVMSSSEQLRD